MRSKILQLFLISSLSPFILQAQFNFMQGYVDMREARIWLGNDYYTQAKIHYREAENTSAKVSIVPITLNENNRYTATAILSPLKPGTSYRYWVEANNPSGATVLFGD
ncbi:MAG: fibronectin type III domain-containing protein, partial [Flavobacteriales bacterium]